MNKTKFFLYIRNGQSSKPIERIFWLNHTKTLNCFQNLKSQNKFEFNRFSTWHLRVIHRNRALLMNVICAPEFRRMNV